MTFYNAFFRYIIIGVIGWGHDHYVSYIKRNNGWEIHNDLEAKIKKTSSKTKINPHVVMYTKI